LKWRESALKWRESALKWRESALKWRESALKWCESALKWRESALIWRESALKWRESVLKWHLRHIRGVKDEVVETPYEPYEAVFDLLLTEKARILASRQQRRGKFAVVILHV
jgi:hypothetical protein